jgi:hypothetical protein
MPKDNNGKESRGIKKPKRRTRRPNRLNRGAVASRWAQKFGEATYGLGSAAFERARPMVAEVGKSVGQSVSKMISEQRVPRSSDNPSWVDLKGGLTEGLRNLGLLNEDDTISPTIYFQSVERFLATHKNIKINRDHINELTGSFRGMPGMPGDVTREIMEEIFKNGITQDSIIEALEYGFQDVLIDGMGIEPEPEPEPGQGFEKARENTEKKQRMAKIVNLSRRIEILLGTDDKLGHYEPLIASKFKELDDLIITNEELKVLKNLVKKYPQLNSMVAGDLKKKKKKHNKTKKNRLRGGMAYRPLTLHEAQRIFNPIAQEIKETMTDDDWSYGTLNGGGEEHDYLPAFFTNELNSRDLDNFNKFRQKEWGDREVVIGIISQRHLDAGRISLHALPLETRSRWSPASAAATKKLNKHNRRKKKSKKPKKTKKTKNN